MTPGPPPRPRKTPCDQLLPSSLAEVKGEMGLAFTESGQAAVEIPKEKDAKYTVSSKDGESCGTKVGVGTRTQCKISSMVRGKCEDYISLGEK